MNAARRFAVPGGGHGGFQAALLEVASDEPDLARQGRQRAFQDPPLGRLRVRVVDLEDGDPAQTRQAVGAGIEARTEDHELLGMLGEGGRDRVIDQPGARDDRGAHARPAAVDVPGREPLQDGDARGPGHQRERPLQERPSQGILEEPAARWKRRLERAEERVLLGGAARVTFPHRLRACSLPRG